MKTEKEELRNVLRCDSGGGGGAKRLALSSQRRHRVRNARSSTATGAGRCCCCCARQRCVGNHSRGKKRGRRERILVRQSSRHSFFFLAEKKVVSFFLAHFSLLSEALEREEGEGSSPCFPLFFFCMSDSRGVPGSSTSPSDEGGQGQQHQTEAAVAATYPPQPTATTIDPSQQRLLLEQQQQQQVPAPALDATIKSRVRSLRQSVMSIDRSHLRVLRHAGIETIDCWKAKQSIPTLQSQFSFCKTSTLKTPEQLVANGERDR